MSRSHLQLSQVLASALAIAAGSAAAEDCAPLRQGQSVTSNVTTIAVSAPSGAQAAATAGIAQWNNCTETGNGEMPLITLGGQGDIAVQVVQGGQNTSGSGGCGRAIISTNSAGRVTGATITLFARDIGGATCDYQAETMAHELGHVLGLGESGCPGRIMGPPVQGIPRAVTGEDCQRAAGQWLTREEIDAGGPGGEGPPNPCGTIIVPLDKH